MNLVRYGSVQSINIKLKTETKHTNLKNKLGEIKSQQFQFVFFLKPSYKLYKINNK